ncbi:MAG: hypothetical protein MZV49_01865 [Rhodopseudomonas palustris]|nr:hypothetical protein [Rhodopseudomonas palustris]
MGVEGIGASRGAQGRSPFHHRQGPLRRRHQALPAWRMRISCAARMRTPGRCCRFCL